MRDKKAQVHPESGSVNHLDLKKEFDAFLQSIIHYSLEFS